MTSANDKQVPVTDAQLRLIAAKLRLDIFRMVTQVGTGHIDSSFSVVDILTALYFSVMTVRPGEPDWPGRDRLVLSKGHAAPALYAALSLAGYFPRADLWQLRQPGSHLQGHPRLTTPGVDAPSGSLGQGLSVAVGIAMALAMRSGQPTSRVFAVLSDGELDEGQTWEAISFAGHQAPRNLVAIVDHNGRQYSTRSRPIFAPDALAEKLTEFGWEARIIDGHSVSELRQCLSQPAPYPLAIVARTVKGRGITFMQDTQHWHGKVPNVEDAELGLTELRCAHEAHLAAASATVSESDSGSHASPGPAGDVQHA